MREALSLLYRGALSSLVNAKGIALNAGDTERDCLRRARAVLTREGHAYFVELVAAWEAIAYAGRCPTRARAGPRRGLAGAFRAGARMNRTRPSCRMLAAAESSAVLALAWLATRIERVPEMEQVGYSGEARRNPYLAALRLAQRMGSRPTR